MKRFAILPGSLLLGLTTTLLGALCLIMQYPLAYVLLAVGVAASLLGLLLVLLEVFASPRASGGDKVLWSALLLTGGTVGGLLYLLAGRDRIAPVQQ